MSKDKETFYCLNGLLYEVQYEYHPYKGFSVAVFNGNIIASCDMGKLYPVDQAPKDTAFFIFREQLKEAIRKKETFQLLPHLVPMISYVALTLKFNSKI